MIRAPPICGGNLRRVYFIILHKRREVRRLISLVAGLALVAGMISLVGAPANATVPTGQTRTNSKAVTFGSGTQAIDVIVKVNFTVMSAGISAPNGRRADSCDLEVDWNSYPGVASGVVAECIVNPNTTPPATSENIVVEASYPGTTGSTSFPANLVNDADTTNPYVKVTVWPKDDFAFAPKDIYIGMDDAEDCPVDLVSLETSDDYYGTNHFDGPGAPGTVTGTHVDWTAKIYVPSTSYVSWWKKSYWYHGTWTGSNWQTSTSENQNVGTVAGGTLLTVKRTNKITTSNISNSPTYGAPTPIHMNTATSSQPSAIVLGNIDKSYLVQPGWSSTANPTTWTTGATGKACRYHVGIANKYFVQSAGQAVIAPGNVVVLPQDDVDDVLDMGDGGWTRQHDSNDENGPGECPSAGATNKYPTATGDLVHVSQIMTCEYVEVSPGVMGVKGKDCTVAAEAAPGADPNTLASFKNNLYGGTFKCELKENVQQSPPDPTRESKPSPFFFDYTPNDFQTDIGSSPQITHTIEFAPDSYVFTESSGPTMRVVFHLLYNYGTGPLGSPTELIREMPSDDCINCNPGDDTPWSSYFVPFDS